MIEDEDDKWCDKCGDETSGKHHCPYQAEINDDYESLCNCCEACAYECAMDV